MADLQHLNSMTWLQTQKLTGQKRLPRAIAAHPSVYPTALEKVKSGAVTISSVWPRDRLRRE